jgi:hypothetical protein
MDEPLLPEKARYATKKRETGLFKITCRHKKEGSLAESILLFSEDNARANIQYMLQNYRFPPQQNI